MNKTDLRTGILLKSKEGEFLWLSPEHLHVDHQYQREPPPEKLRKLPAAGVGRRVAP